MTRFWSSLHCLLVLWFWPILTTGTPSPTLAYDTQQWPSLGYDGTIIAVSRFDNGRAQAYDSAVALTIIRKIIQAARPSGFYDKFANFLAAEGGIQTLDASAIRFSQSSVNNVGEIADSMAANGWQGSPVTVVRMADGSLTTVDNTRVLAAGLTGTPVQATIFDAGASIDASQAIRFVGPNGGLPTTWGDAVLNRIGNQNSLFRTTYPSGSPVTGLSSW